MPTATVATDAGKQKRPANVVGLIALLICCNALGALAAFSLGGFSNGHREQLWGYQVAYATVILAVALVYLKIAEMSWREAGLTVNFRRRPSAWLFLAAMALSLGITFVFLISRFISFRPNYHLSVVRAVCICTLVPVAEEVLYRGWFQTAVTRARPSATEWNTAFVTAGVFAVCHFVRLLQDDPLKSTIYLFVPLFALGLMNARARQITGNIVTPIALHAVYNTTGMLLTQALWVISKR